MLYLIYHDVCLTAWSPIMERQLVAAGQAVIDPPYRHGGYRVADDDADLYIRLQRRACDMDRRRREKGGVS